MSLTKRTVSFVALTAVAVLCCLLFSKSPTDPRAGIVVWLPRSIPAHWGEEGSMGVAETAWLPDDTTFLKMTYFEKGFRRETTIKRALHATLIVAGSDSRSLHRPQVCLTAQGWTISKRELVTLKTSGGPLEVMDFHLNRFEKNADGSVRLNFRGNKVVTHAHYVYWWIGPSSTTASDEEKVWSSVWNSILNGENERWAYPSVMVQVDERPGHEIGDRDARRRAFDFIKEYAPSFQRSLGAQDRPDARPLNSL